MKDKPLIVIERVEGNEKQTLGRCSIFLNDSFRFLSASLERGWLDNKPSVSCIPKGEYKVKFEYSNRFKRNLWEIKDVPNRSECKFHISNYWYQLEGCIALGSGLGDINKDGFTDILNSGRTMDDFHLTLNGYDEAILIIK